MLSVLNTTVPLSELYPTQLPSAELGQPFVQLQDVHVFAPQGTPILHWGFVGRSNSLERSTGKIPVALATIGIWTVASWGVTSGSNPLPEVVTRSQWSMPSLCQDCMSSSVYLSRTLYRARGRRRWTPRDAVGDQTVASSPRWVSEAA